MSVEVALRTILLDDVDVAALAGTRIAPKLSQTPAKDAEGHLLGAITYKKISGLQDQLLDFAHPRMQVTAWGETPADAKALAAAIRFILQRYKGTVGTVRITQITFMNDLDLNDPVTGYETVPADYQVSYWEE